jgi:hypothetical protein
MVSGMYEVIYFSASDVFCTLRLVE